MVWVYFQRFIFPKDGVQWAHILTFARPFIPLHTDINIGAAIFGNGLYWRNECLLHGGVPQTDTPRYLDGWMHVAFVCVVSSLQSMAFYRQLPHVTRFVIALGSTCLFVRKFMN